MSLPVKLLTVEGEEIQEPYLIRMAGWNEGRYFREAPETRIVEFEDGEIIVHSPAGIRHQEVTRFLTFLLTGYGETRGLGNALNGPAVVRLRPGLLYEPDIFFVRSEQQPHLRDDYFSGSPALIVEIVSRGTRGHDLKTKAASYHEHHVEEYWAVDLEKQFFFQHLLSNGYQPARFSNERVMSLAVPGFWIEASWLWRKPLPAALGCLQQLLAQP